MRDLVVGTVSQRTVAGGCAPAGGHQVEVVAVLLESMADAWSGWSTSRRPA